MTRCSYGHWNGLTFSHTCGRMAEFLVNAPTRRQMCSHHAAIAEALGWTVTNVMRPGVPPSYDAPKPVRHVA